MLLLTVFVSGCAVDTPPPRKFTEKAYIATYELKCKDKSCKSKVYKIKIASDGKRYKRFDVVEDDKTCPIERGMNDYLESKHYGPGAVEGAKTIWWRRFTPNDIMLDEESVETSPSAGSIAERKINGRICRGWDMHAKEQYWYDKETGCLVSVTNKKYDIKLTNLKKEALPQTAFEIPENSELVPDIVWELHQHHEQSHKDQ